MKSIFKGTIFGIIAAGLIMALAVQLQPARAQAITDSGAPADLVIKTGSTESHVYHKLTSQLMSVCKTPVVDAKTSSGSPESLDALLSNSANLVWVAEDTLIARKQIENDSRVDGVRIFLPTFYTELHMLALASNQTFNRFSELSNKKVGTYAGSYTTMRILLAKAGMRASVENFKTEAEAIKALNDGKIDVFTAISGAPAVWMKGLTSARYKLLTFDMPEVLAKVNRQTYTMVNLRYPDISPSAIRTAGVRVSLVTYNYESNKKKTDLSALKNCLTANIVDLRETTGNLDKWRDINPTATSTDWEMFKPIPVKNTTKR